MVGEPGGGGGGQQETQPRWPPSMAAAHLPRSQPCVCFPFQDYPSYPGFPQSQYSQYYSSSYNPPYVPASSICSSPLSTSTYVLQEASHSVPNQSSESLGGKYSHCRVVIRVCGLSSFMKGGLDLSASRNELVTQELTSALRYISWAFLCVCVCLLFNCIHV